MSQPIPGRLSRLYVSTDDGTTWKRVGGRVDMNLNLARGEINASHMDSGGWATYLMGRRDWSISGTLRYIEGDPGQEAIKEHVYAEEGQEKNLLVRFLLEEAVGSDEWQGAVFATANDLSSADESPSDLSLTLRGTGPLERAAQTENP